MDLKILLIDDNEIDRQIFKKYIRKAGNEISIVEASTAQQALGLIAEGQSFNCIFLDYRLPDMDGISMLKKIYDKELDIATSPVVMLTGQGSESVAIDAIRYGAQDYLIKDHISTDTLYIALAKAREVFDLKQSRSEAKKLLEHSQKMDAVGKLTGGIAHDFNNLLTITFGHTRLLLDMLSAPDLDPENCMEKVKTIQKATQRGAELVKRLMVFSRQRTLEPETLNINEAIEELEELLRRSLGEFVEIKTELESSLDLIDVDPSQLEHAIINMGVNARDAMADGGTFTIKTENIQIPHEQAEQLDIDEGSYVALIASDTGYGMSVQTLEKIFDPFFTTKDIGKGSGLGLSMVYNFVRESGGAVEVESEKGAGTTFRLYFPKSDKQQTQFTVQDNEQEIIAPVETNKTILVVEDEDEIRNLAAMMLQHVGYKVLEAANGNDALDILKRDNDNIELVFTDISMPGGMNGVQMAARAQALKPEIKLLFTSGYADGAVPDMDLAAQYPVINKPYQPDDLMKKIRQVLEGA